MPLEAFSPLKGKVADIPCTEPEKSKPKKNINLQSESFCSINKDPKALMQM